LDIRREGADGRRCSIAVVLDLTVTQARAFFADAPEVASRLTPLADVGLEYLKLGQPVPTLSGGEAQRLKLAGHLARAAAVPSSTTHRGKLFLFDEPTTGLHFEDVAKLLKAFRKLLIAGHSLLVIEHNLDVIRAADWIIDLGPEGGERGGEIICAGTAAQVGAHAHSFTGQALRAYEQALSVAAQASAPAFVTPAACPDVDAIFGIPPTVAIEQRTSRGGRKSTVATLTEIYHFLRLLYVKLGTQYCPDCDRPIEPQSAASIGARLVRDYRGKRIALLAPLIVARKGYYTDLAKWAARKGFKTLRVDGEALPTAPWPRLSRFREHTIELPVAEIDVGVRSEAALRAALARALDFGKGLV